MKNLININFKNPKGDILSGIIVAFVSIPISMGYAQVAGLPAVFGLYGSLLPVLVYAFFSSSPQFVIGVDAMPAAMVGASLAASGIISGSEEAIKTVPVISLLVAIWLLIFFILKADRVVKYISNSVMGGFISGVGCTIILMQFPKLFGGNAGCGEILQLIPHIVEEFSNFNLASFIIGIVTVVIILTAKKFIPKFPMAIVMLGLGIVLTAVFKIDSSGVKLLSSVEAGFPDLIIPDLRILKGQEMNLAVLSLTIALVIMAQTLLAANSYALKYDYKLNTNRELLAYSAMNVAGAVSGSCPINGSVSRAAMADQFGCKSQLMSVTAFVTMLIVVLFCTKFFVYLPVPVLTGIVLSALIGIIDYKQAIKLWKCNRGELVIFVFAFAGVLFLGTIYGVLIGVLLSFAAVVKKAVIPPRALLGKIPGHHGYYNLKRNRKSTPIINTVIYRFGGNLFFANIGTFESDVFEAIKDDTKQVIIDAGGIGDIDVTAAERILILSDKLEKKGIKFYLTEHQGHINDQLRLYGAEKLILKGQVRRTISLALRDCGYKKPYPLEGVKELSEYEYVEADEKLAEFEWAFGEEADEKMNEFAGEMEKTLTTVEIENIHDINIEKVEEKLTWGKIGLFDEEALLEHLEMRLEQLEEKGKLKKEQLAELEELIEGRKNKVELKLRSINPKAMEMLNKRMSVVDEFLKKRNPEGFEHLNDFREKLKNRIKK